MHGDQGGHSSHLHQQQAGGHQGGEKVASGFQEDDGRRRRPRRSMHHGSEGGSQRPYFERIDEFNGDFDKRDGYVRRLEVELEDYKKLCDESKRRLSALEYINDDLEKRLEAEACRRFNLESELETGKEEYKQGRRVLTTKINTLEEKLLEKELQEAKMNDQLRRLERELYRMHQKKHEIVKEVRRQEAQDRADGAEASQILRAQAAAIEGRSGPVSSSRRGVAERRTNQLQDEAMAVAYFSQPSPALAEEQSRFRMAQSLGQFFAC
mmetsp:Transcript_7643/g.12365  ORF Transcript_7643/g.12365 Transcript_7643/m.12365 type:complete len:267 (-) Transcript_7643:35-835(-)